MNVSCIWVSSSVTEGIPPVYMHDQVFWGGGDKGPHFSHYECLPGDICRDDLLVRKRFTFSNVMVRR